MQRSRRPSKFEALGAMKKVPPMRLPFSIDIWWLRHSIAFFSLPSISTRTSGASGYMTKVLSAPKT